ncbi:MAG: ASKHA domain-containing protein, partial [Acidimicrobiales bacterium]
MSGEQHRVVFTPSGLETKVGTGESVLDAARSLGVDIDSVCGGRGICGRCQVTAPTGRFDKWALTVEEDALSPIGPTESGYHGKRPLKPGHRLSCQAQVVTEVIIDVPPESQINKQIVRKEVNLEGITLDPTVHLHYLEIPKAVLGDDATAADLIVDALETQWNRPGVRIATRLLQSLHRAVTSPEGGATVAVSTAEGSATVVAIWPGFYDDATGIAIDVGSTTIAGHAIDLESGEVLASAGRMNPQIRFGEDLMSRVSFVMMNPDGLEELTSAVRGALADLIDELRETAGRSADSVLSISMVGNPVMHHILLGIDPTPLGAAPFLLTTARAIVLDAPDLDLRYENAQVYIGPCIAGHVGADTAAAVLAEGPHRSPRTQLLVDIGTNAEIVLGNQDRLYAASSPT